MDIPDYGELVEKTRKAFMSGRTLDLAWRRRQLKQLLKMFTDESDRMQHALKQDLHKCKFESVGMEINFGRNEVICHLNQLDEWAKGSYIKKDLSTLMDTCYVKPEPLGVVLIIGAWNYPVQLTLHPLVGAVSAGNCAVIKPSELAPATAQLLAELVPQYLDPDCYHVVNGAVPETTTLLKERFDKIFFTGNGQVGRVVMAAAARHLTPVTLELGGKSPCYVHEDSDLELVARRIVWGKFINCGQTCIAPDYVLCTKRVQEKLVRHMKETLGLFFTDDPQKSPDYSRIINSRHFNRLTGLLKGVTVALGGRTDAADLYIEPTVVTGTQPSDACMQDEIFGPILPIMTVENLDDAIQFIKSREKPLAMYAFSNDRRVTSKLVELTSSGGFLANDTVLHVSLDTLPFGGVGASGMGSYHGKFSFDCFSHNKSVMIKKQTLETVNTIRYPPFSDCKLVWLDRLLRKSVRPRGIWGSYLPILLLGLLLGAVLKLLGLQRLLPRALTD